MLCIAITRSGRGQVISIQNGLKLIALLRYAYLPFGDGPRVCIGANFAINEVVIILASLLKRFRFKPVAGLVPSPKMILTLRPEGGVWLMAEPI
jgi:cytochrome P450